MPGTALLSDVRLIRCFLSGGSRGLSHVLVTETVKQNGFCFCSDT